MKRKQRNRRGSMLAQMVVVMTCMSILITLSGMLLFRLLHQQVEMTKAVVQTGTWTRLARDFRNDVHAARSAKQTGEAGNALELTFDDGTVTWRSDGEFVHRAHRPADSQTGPELTPGERYRCQNATATFSLSQAEATGSLAVLQVAPVDSSEASYAATSLRISTAVGLSRRHEGGAAE
ncbi:MAG: hypothetical protein O2820_10310 [Planctomycetota bacterium]|nr:hypothetical protein [Planctomycetota bacterium]MDA1249605.1 hypothetical protein [Planctomycetota bacterium]